MKNITKDSTDISIKVVERIADCHIIWDEFLPAQHHLTSANIQSFEDAHIEDIENYYVQVFLKNKLIGLVYLQQFQFQHKYLNFDSNQQILSKIIKYVLPRKLPILVCGNLFRINFQGFYFKNPSHKKFVFKSIELFAKQYKVCKPRGVIIKDCEDIFIEQLCKGYNYQFFDGDVTMEMKRRANWLSFDDYLNDLTKKYFQRAKKILKSFESVNSVQLNADDILQQSSEINRLYLNVVDKQTVKLGIVNPNYFYQLKSSLGNKFEFHALYVNDKMMGFYTFIFYEKEMETHYIGLDYEANKTYQIYFNILFLGVKKMIEKQFDSLELGRTARDAKANVGAQPKQIFNYICVNNPVVKITLRHFLKNFNQNEDNNIVNRSPLK